MKVNMLIQVLQAISPEYGEDDIEGTLGNSIITLTINTANTQIQIGEHKGTFIDSTLLFSKDPSSPQ